jgi:3-phytase
VALSGGVAYIGGDFTSVTDGSTTRGRQHMVAITEATGQPTGFVADTNGTVNTLAVVGNKLYLGGSFTTVTDTVSSKARRNFARVDLASGIVDGYQLDADDIVWDLWYQPSAERLYVGGDFKNLGGTARVRVAALNASTGAMIGTFAPTPDRRVSSVAASGNIVYLGGRLKNVNGQPVLNLAAVSATDGSLLPPRFNGVEAPDPATTTSDVLDLDVSPDGNTLFVGIGGQHFNVVGAWPAAGGVRNWWHGFDLGPNPPKDHLDGDVQGIVYNEDDGQLYFGFHGGYNGDNTKRLMAVDAVSGDPGPIVGGFQPPMNGTVGVADVATDGEFLAAVGDFTGVSGVTLGGLAFFPRAGSPPPTTTSTTAASTSTTIASTTTTTASTTTIASTTTTTDTTLPTGGTKTVTPFAETINYQPKGTNDADDPAMWVHPTNPAKSLVLATLKQQGMDIYTPAGVVVQSIAAGTGHRYNNVEVVYGVTLGGLTRDLAIVTDRSTDKLHVFAINGDASPPLTEVTATSVPLVFGTTAPVKNKTTYGIAAWRRPSNGKAEVFVTQENTTNLAKLELTDAGGGKVSYQKVGSMSFPSTFSLPGGGTWTPCFNPSHPDWLPHAEGMVVDPGTGMLWADQELVGLWRIGTDLSSPTLMHKITRFGQTWTVVNGKCSINTGSKSYGESYLPGDLEGLSLYRAGAGTGGYLIFSNQNASTFGVFDRDGGTYRGTFKLGAVGSIDKVTQTDGLAVINVPLGPSAPQGLLVTQDGANAPFTGTNFKFTSWPAVASQLGLTVNTGGSPRS